MGNFAPSSSDNILSKIDEIRDSLDKKIELYAEQENIKLRDFISEKMSVLEVKQAALLSQEVARKIEEVTKNMRDKNSKRMSLQQQDFDSKISDLVILKNSVEERMSEIANRVNNILADIRSEHDELHTLKIKIQKDTQSFIIETDSKFEKMFEDLKDEFGTNVNKKFDEVFSGLKNECNGLMNSMRAAIELKRHNLENEDSLLSPEPEK